VWIPETAKQGWLIITRDSRIQEHERERAAVREYGARMIAIASADGRGPWQQLEAVMCQWRRIEALLEQDGPFIYSLTRTTLRPVAL
jgi:hypothetical protein